MDSNTKTKISNNCNTLLPPPPLPCVTHYSLNGRRPSGEKKNKKYRFKHWAYSEMMLRPNLPKNSEKRFIEKLDTSCEQNRTK